MSVWFVVAGAAVVLMVVAGSVIAALVAVVTEAEKEGLLDAE